MLNQAPEAAPITDVKPMTTAATIATIFTSDIRACRAKHMVLHPQQQTGPITTLIEDREVNGQVLAA